MKTEIWRDMAWKTPTGKTEKKTEFRNNFAMGFTLNLWVQRHFATGRIFRFFFRVHFRQV